MALRLTRSSSRERDNSTAVVGLPPYRPHECGQPCQAHPNTVPFFARPATGSGLQSACAMGQSVRITLCPVSLLRFHEPCSAAKTLPEYSGGYVDGEQIRFAD